MASDGVKIMKGMMVALDAQDFEKAAKFFADDCVYEDVPMGMITHSAKEFIGFARIVRGNFPDRKWEMTSAFSDGNKVATESVWSGTFTNSDDPKRPATGKHASVRVVSITEIRNGKICKNTDYYDGLSLSQQLGMGPPSHSK
jgi:steroid delta-isomerase-like uncharacterized protein